MRISTLLAVLTVVVIAISATPAAERISTTYTMPVRLQGAVEASGCDNSPGPYVTLGGSLTLDGLGAGLIFKNNVRGTHTLKIVKTVDVVLLPDGQAITIPKQPVSGGTGGNPFIWIQLLDGNGAPLSGEIFLGRCVQGLFAFAADFGMLSTATADVTVGDCSNRGPSITLSGELALTGIKGRLIFRNNDNPVGGPHQADATTTIDIVIIPAGESITIPKQPVQGGVGGNPLISVVFLEGGGGAISDEFELGRCVSLAK